MKRVFLLLWVTMFLRGADAQWVSKTYVLQPGWNAVYFPFQPVPGDCDHFFDGVPVESVSWWCRTVGDAEYQSDPDAFFPRSSHWRKWLPDNSDATTFDSLLAGESYLINLATNISWTIQAQGAAVIVPADWVHDEYNLAGFPVAESVTFGTLFAFSDRIEMSGIQQMNADGSASALPRAASATVESGKAYWVTCGSLATDFAGPIRLELGTAAKRMDFSAQLYPQSLKIFNDTEAVRSVTLRHSASETPPSGAGIAPLAGKTPLLLEVTEWSASRSVVSYRPLPDSLVTNVPAGDVLTLKLMPDVESMMGADAGSAWQSILQVSDEGNVENSGAAVVRQQVGIYCDTPDPETFNPFGLWVGAVCVTEVSRAPTMAGVSNVWNSAEPVAVTRDYTFRVLLHCDDTDQQWRILQRAYVATDENGADSIFTDMNYAKDFMTAHPDCGVTRISSVNLPLIDPQRMESDGTNLTVTVTLPYDDPVNPFVHPFHPQHDNKEYPNGVVHNLPEGEESQTVSRTMTFRFAATDPLKPGNPAWNISEKGGAFEEAVSGLNKTIYVSGSFRLQRVSGAGVLKYLEL